ncbi:MAG: HlyD family efflux transporter periplasmic adaptor subunit [Planctomycetes bacterium]|nr:HlyD family efflux transporter periplasmic adaptor subunit [Planctomycetota bacterium]
MPAPTGFNAVSPSADSLRQQLERSIDELAELSRGNLEPGQFFGQVLRRALHPGGARQVILWRPSLEGPWEPAGELPPTAEVDSDRTVDRQDLLNDVANDSQPRILRLPPDVASGDAGGSQVLSPLRHAGATVGILETVHPLSDGGPSAAIYQYFAALSEIAADFLSQQELQQLRHAKTVWLQWDQYQQRLAQSPDLSTVCATVANDGRLVIGCDRISVLVNCGGHFRVTAISGVERPDPRSGVVRSLEMLARQLAGLGHTYWAAIAADGTNEPESQKTIERYCQESGVTNLGVVPMMSTTQTQPDAMIVFESFSLDERWPERQGRAESLVARSAFHLRAAKERSEIPWLETWQRFRRSRWILQRPGVKIAAVVLAALVSALVVIPAELTIGGQGELWPSTRREVFASTSGIVDQILVVHGDEVREQQPLIVLRDPDLELEVPRVTGEIATMTERLRAVQIARLTGAVTADTMSRARQLTAEEEELKERLKTLERQLALVEDRRQKLTLRSPIAGRVLTWDVIQHLTARPVERGQSLLTIGETDGSWILEVRVADKDAGHMLRGRKRSSPGLPVDFQLPSEPGRTYRGSIRDVALASESDDRSTGHVRVVVEFDRTQVEQLRPGATAVPRIHCGRQSLGYVWLHDFIDAVRLRLLFW